MWVVNHSTGRHVVHLPIFAYHAFLKSITLHRNELTELLNKKITKTKLGVGNINGYTINDLEIKIQDNVFQLGY